VGATGKVLESIVEYFQWPWRAVIILIIVEVLIGGHMSIDLIFLPVYDAIVVVTLVLVVIFFFREHNVNKTSVKVYSEAAF
jgi:uncharacterized membrane protein